MKVVAIITARGGSKRIPRKNIRSFAGKPILCYSIDAALESGIFTSVIVSTDDGEIADLAIASGAEVPFFRSAQTSDDYSTTAEVLLEVLLELRAQGQLFEQACCLYPTAPFVTAEKLRRAQETLTKSGADVVMPVARFGYPIWRALQKDENGQLSFYWPEHEAARSQDLPAAFHDVGQFYFFQTERFLCKKSLFTGHTVGIEVSPSDAQDIDTEEDWKVAELKFLQR